MGRGPRTENAASSGGQLSTRHQSKRGPQSFQGLLSDYPLPVLSGLAEAVENAGIYEYEYQDNSEREFVEEGLVIKGGASSSLTPQQNAELALSAINAVSRYSDLAQELGEKPFGQSFSEEEKTDLAASVFHAMRIQKTHPEVEVLDDSSFDAYGKLPDEYRKELREGVIAAQRFPWRHTDSSGHNHGFIDGEKNPNAAADKAIADQRFPQRHTDWSGHNHGFIDGEKNPNAAADKLRANALREIDNLGDKTKSSDKDFDWTDKKDSVSFNDPDSGAYKEPLDQMYRHPGHPDNARKGPLTKIIEESLKDNKKSNSDKLREVIEDQIQSSGKDSDWADKKDKVSSNGPDSKSNKLREKLSDKIASSNESVGGKDSGWTDKKDKVSFNGPDSKSPDRPAWPPVFPDLPDSFYQLNEDGRPTESDK